VIRCMTDNKRIKFAKISLTGISRHQASRKITEAVRSHWDIEYGLPWQLDVTFQEDQARVRLGYANANFSILRRTRLSLLKNELTAHVGIKNKRLQAGWDEPSLESVFLGAYLMTQSPGSEARPMEPDYRGSVFPPEHGWFCNMVASAPAHSPGREDQESRDRMAR
jgi:hypothetical protein